MRRVIESLFGGALLLSLVLCAALDASADKDKGEKDAKKKDLRVTVQIPIDGLCSNDDAAYLAKVLRQKLGGRAECDVIGRDTILLKVEQGAKVSLVDLKRVVEKVGRKRRCTLRIGDPQLRGRVELSTRLKRPKAASLRALAATLKAMPGVVAEQANSRSVKRLPLEISSKTVRLSDLKRAIVSSLRLNARQAVFRDVIWHGPPGGGGGKGGPATPGGKPTASHMGGLKLWQRK